MSSNNENVQNLFSRRESVFESMNCIYTHANIRLSNT